MRALARFLPLLLALALPLPAHAGKPAKKKKAAAPAAAAVAPAPPPRVQVVVASLVDRRVNEDFPKPSLDVTLKLEGEDARAVVSARARVTKAEDDTGRSLLPAQSSDEWQEARGEEPPAPSVSLGSPERKARALKALEGTFSVYLPSRDPNALVTVPKVFAGRDGPALASAALAKEKIRLRVLSKNGLEKERKAAAEKKKAEAAKKRKGKPAEGFEQMGEAMADAFGQMFERLFMMAGEHDLILEVRDPAKKVFSFGLAQADGTPLETYGTTDIENYRIVRLLEEPPEGAALLVRLKTPRAMAEVPFQLADVKLP